MNSEETIKPQQSGWSELNDRLRTNYLSCNGKCLRLLSATHKVGSNEHRTVRLGCRSIAISKCRYCDA